MDLEKGLAQGDLPLTKGEASFPHPDEILHRGYGHELKEVPPWTVQEIFITVLAGVSG